MGTHEGLLLLFIPTLNWRHQRSLADGTGLSMLFQIPRERLINLGSIHAHSSRFLFQGGDLTVSVGLDGTHLFAS